MAKKTAAKTPAASKTAKPRQVEPDVPAKKGNPVKETKARASAVPPKSKSPKPAATTTDITTDMIAEKAYHLWLAGHPGGEYDHWIAAERELRGK